MATIPSAEQCLQVHDGQHIRMLLRIYIH